MFSFLIHRFFFLAALAQIRKVVLVCEERIEGCLDVSEAKGLVLVLAADFNRQVKRVEPFLRGFSGAVAVRTSENRASNAGREVRKRRRIVIPQQM